MVQWLMVDLHGSSANTENLLRICSGPANTLKEIVQVTQYIVLIRDAKRKENIQKQERQWFALTGNRSTASASLGAPMEAMVTMTETASASSVGAEGMTLTAVTSTTEGDTVDL